MARVYEPKRLEPFGATKKRGKENAATRALKNRIFELEQEVEALKRSEAAAIAKANDAERRRVEAKPNDRQFEALRAITRVSIGSLVRLHREVPGIVDHVVALGWLAQKYEQP